MILRLILFVFLSVLTQVGGLIYVLSLFVCKKYFRNSKLKSLAVFVSFYLVFTFLIIPFIAPIFGREKIQNTDKIKPTNYLTVLLNRNYVVPKINEILASTEQELKNTNIQIRYLDANFPFLNRFPLLPHLSHHDGKKLDLSLVYETRNGKITNKKKSISGYGDFVEPKKGEINQTKICKDRGFVLYDFTKYLTFGKINDELRFSKKGTKKLILSILKNKNLGKIFIEPHLKKEINLIGNKIRYHGCKAVRHDDHIRLQLK